MPQPKLTDKQVCQAIKLYKNSLIKLEKICKIFKVSEETIRRAMKRNNIPMRVTVGFCDHQNSNWKGGHSLHYAKNVAIRNLKTNECVICGYKISTDVHHWDRNKKNNNPNNLVLVCPNHHREIHLGLISKENIKYKRKEFTR